MKYRKLLTLSLFILFSCNKSEDTLTLIPEGYSGTIKILFNQENGKNKEYEGEKRIYKIPKNGILKTKFNPQYQYHFPEYYYVSKNGKRTKIQHIENLNKNVLDTIDKNKIYVFNNRSMGKGFEIDSLGNENILYNEGLIFEVGNPLK